MIPNVGESHGSATMGKVLDEATVERFHRDGFYAPVRVASRDETLRMRARLETYEA